MSRINLVNVLGTVGFILMILTIGFTDGGNYIAAVACLIGCCASLFWANRENGRR